MFMSESDSHNRPKIGSETLGCQGALGKMKQKDGREKREAGKKNEGQKRFSKIFSMIGGFLSIFTVKLCMLKIKYLIFILIL